MKPVSLCIAAGCLCLALGIGTAVGAGTGNSTASNDKATLEAALSACAASVSQDSNGRPDPKAMDSCMSAKGFTKPAGPPPGQGGGNQDRPPPPPDQSGQSMGQ